MTFENRENFWTQTCVCEYLPLYYLWCVRNRLSFNQGFLLNTLSAELVHDLYFWSPIFISGPTPPNSDYKLLSSKSLSGAQLEVTTKPVGTLHILFFLLNFLHFHKHVSIFHLLLSKENWKWHLCYKLMIMGSIPTPSLPIILLRQWTRVTFSFSFLLLRYNISGKNISVMHVEILLLTL